MYCVDGSRAAFSWLRIASVPNEGCVVRKTFSLREGEGGICAAVVCFSAQMKSHGCSGAGEPWPEGGFPRIFFSHQVGVGASQPRAHFEMHLRPPSRSSFCLCYSASASPTPCSILMAGIRSLELRAWLAQPGQLLAAGSPDRRTCVGARQPARGGQSLPTAWPQMVGRSNGEELG